MHENVAGNADRACGKFMFDPPGRSLSLYFRHLSVRCVCRHEGFIHASLRTTLPHYIITCSSIMVRGRGP